MMSLMTSEPPLPVVPAGAVPVGEAAHVVADADGGRVFVRGELTFVWDAGDEVGRRLAAVQLVRIQAATAVDVAAAFDASTVTLWRWRTDLTEGGVGALADEKKGPKGPSKLTEQVVADIRSRRAGKASLRAIAAAVGVSTGSVRRALAGEPTAVEPTPEKVTPEESPGGGAPSDANDNADADAGDDGAGVGVDVGVDVGGGLAPVAVLPVLGAPVARRGERAAARAGLLQAAEPVFTPCARVPLAGLFLALPALAATGLLTCANSVFGALPGGFYGLDTVLLDWVARVLVGEPRAEGATRVDPLDLGRFLGMDRAPEVKTIRRRLTHLAAAGKGADLLEAMATHLLARENAQDQDVPFLFYVDGHVRAYHGTRKVAKTHLARTRFPAPATLETWVADAHGDPVLVVMAEPGASLAGELRRLVPTLRAAVGHERRVLVAFDRGGWSPALFKDLHEAAFDVMTWRKGAAPDLPAEAFTQVTYLDPGGGAHSWDLADTTVDLPLGEAPGAGTFRMRQVTRRETKKGRTRQIHVVTTRTDLTPGEVMHAMGMRWRQENHFRYARMRLDLDSHDSYEATDDDPARMVPNPAKTAARAEVATARAHLAAVRARTDTNLLRLRSPEPGTDVTITNAMLADLTADLRAAQADLTTAQETNKATPARLPLAQVNPGQQILDIETKLITHAVKIAAYRVMTTLARDIRLNTDYARAGDEAHALARQILTHTGDIHPQPGTLTIRLDPLPTARATRAAEQLCEHLSATATTYPGTQMITRYEVKNRP